MTAPVGKRTRRGGRRSAPLIIDGGITTSGSIEPNRWSPSRPNFSPEDRAQRVLRTLGALVLKMQENEKGLAAPGPTTGV